MEPKYVIETRGLTKRYSGLTAVDNLSICVRKGEIYGFLGLNGAGKTTTIRMLLGLANPTSGQAFLEGQLIKAGEAGPWNDVGYLVETPTAYPDLSVLENLKIITRLRHLSDKVIDPVIEQLHLGAYKSIKAGNLSLGNAQRLGLAKALLHNPKILILDEPSNGLDPVGIVEVRETLKTLAREKGVTIFISSHILGEVAKLTTRIGIIHKGRMVREFEAAELNQPGKNKQILDLKNRDNVLAGLRRLGLEARPGENHNSVEVWHEEDLESYFLHVILQNAPHA